MTVALVTGADGFIGQHLQKRLSGEGVEVRRFVRGVPALNERSNLQHWSEYLEGVDAIYHLAAIAHRKSDITRITEVNARWPARLYAAAGAAGVGRFIYLSSIKVLGDYSSRPLRPQDPYAPTDAYALSKVQAEQGLLAAQGNVATQLAIVRPPLTYGPGVKANFLALLRMARLAQNGIPLPLADAAAPRSILGVDNLCDLLHCLLQSGAGIFHCADAESISVHDLLQLIASLSDKSIRFWRISPALLKATFRVLGRGGAYSRLFDPLEVDQSETLRVLGWSAPHSTENQLAGTLQWLR